MSESERRPLIGVAVICLCPKVDDGECILLSQRLKGHGKGCFQLPGGHLEYEETFEECAQRELKEETNLDGQSFRLVYLTNSIFSENSKQYLTLFLQTTIDDPSQLKCLEPEKNSPWTWIKWKDLKSLQLFTPLQQLVNDHNFNPFQNPIPSIPHSQFNCQRTLPHV